MKKIYSGLCAAILFALIVIGLISTFDKDATESKKQDIVSQRKQTNYNKKLQEWKDAVQVVEESPWKKLEVNDTDAYTELVASSSVSSSSAVSGSSVTSSSAAASGSSTVSSSGR